MARIFARKKNTPAAPREAIVADFILQAVDLAVFYLCAYKVSSERLRFVVPSFVVGRRLVLVILSRE
jgi:hypothetical protein